MTAEKTVREILRDVGFARVGFARLGELPANERFREWIRRGYHGSMQYLADGEAKRCDPSLIRDGFRSVIVVAAPYRTRSTPEPSGPDPRGRISVYARGTDYHRVLEKRLRRGRNEMRERLDASFRYYVDNGPVLEKPWAAEAGLGWIGKNTCSIDAAHGSFFFLGVVFTSLELEPDAPATDQCGQCRACLDACPTDAFPEPYVLDARRCISYLTIEQRGEMPEDLEPGVGDWIFGCDICQEVCPFNHEDTFDGDPDLAPRPENAFPELENLLGLDEEQLRERFRASPILRPKLEGLLRNSIVALSNSGDPAHVDLLRQLREDPRFRESEVLRATLDRACKRLEARG